MGRLFPLISTLALNGGVLSSQSLDQFARSATKMALTHNVIIRGMNSIYLQCQHVTPQMAASFLLYCRCWAEFIQNHHACEEIAYFPIIEKAVGVEGLSEGNLEQHDAFLAGLQRYVYHAQPIQYSGEKLTEIFDSFAATLQSHLTDKVVWIMALSRFQQLDIAAIDNYQENYAGIHATWPILVGNLAETTGLGGRVRNFWLRYVCMLAYRHAWKYSSCTVGGKPKALEGAATSPRDERLKGRDGAIELASGHSSDDSLQV
ncbi:hypothetical protein EV426DRAFT_710617 [Tirmania nivea]|nr:hypothetical protein EV426DRAFT_710617 [Tirmania nivea]